MNKYKIALEIMTNSYNEALKVETNVNSKAGFKITCISILLTFNVSMINLFFSREEYYSNSTKCLGTILGCCSILLLIISLSMVLFALIIKKREALPTENLIEDFKNYDETKPECENEIYQDVIDLYVKVARSLDDLNDKRSKILTISNYILLITLFFLFIFSIITILI